MKKLSASFIPSNNKVVLFLTRLFLPSGILMLAAFSMFFVKGNDVFIAYYRGFGQLAFGLLMILYWAYFRIVISISLLIPRRTLRRVVTYILLLIDVVILLSFLFILMDAFEHGGLLRRSLWIIIMTGSAATLILSFKKAREGLLLS